MAGQKRGTRADGGVAKSVEHNADLRFDMGERLPLIIG
jgi:hypothetical protein